MAAAKHHRTVKHVLSAQNKHLNSCFLAFGFLAIQHIYCMHASLFFDYLLVDYGGFVCY